MKKSELQLMIRKIVREEVAMTIHEVINELKQPSLSSPQPKQEKKIVEKKQFTKNSILNEVMNETAASDEWKTLGGGTYYSSKANEVLQASYGDMMNDSPNGTIAAEMGVNPNDPSVDFLKKDYRNLMKKVDEKAKQKRGA